MKIKELKKRKEILEAEFKELDNQITILENIEMKFREEGLIRMNNIHENALRHYLEEINFKDTFAYTYDYSENKFIIYTCRPGIWIGKGGEGVDLLKKILASEVAENCSVEFKEIRGRFVTCE